MFRYVIKVSPREVAGVAKEIVILRSKIEAAYAEECKGLTLCSTDHPMKLWAIIERPRSIVIEVSDGTRLNVLSDVFAKFFGNKVQLPYWG
jgi:hypothetical protein